MSSQAQRQPKRDRKAYMRRWREANKEHVKAYREARQSLQNAYYRDYLNDPLRRGKHLARLTVSNAIAQGKLTRGSCEKCGAAAEAHHDDYSKPFEVRWLCREHHIEHHNNERTNN